MDVDSGGGLILVDLTLAWFTAQGVISWGVTTAAVINWQSSKNDNSRGLNFVHILTDHHFLEPTAALWSVITYNDTPENSIFHI